MYRSFGTLCVPDSVPKRRHIKFRRREITQKKEYNIHNMAIFGNQEQLACIYIIYVAQSAEITHLLGQVYIVI